MSFINERVQPEGLTFDDVLLVPAYSEVLPREVSIKTRFSRNIALNIPIVSAAMDTVTEAPLAIALAREGGIGVIHKNMSIEAQAAQVRRVKRAENGMIYDPVTIAKDDTVGDALNLMKENKIGGIPVVDGQKRLIGIVTNRDLRFQSDMGRLIADVMTPAERLVTTQSTELATAKQVLLENKIEKLPVVDDDGRLAGLITYKDITKVQDHPNACKDAKGRLRVAAGVGITPDVMDRVAALVAEDVDAVVLDSAHGHSANIVKALRAIKAAYPELDVVVGNIATAEAARFLVENGADGIKVGIGPGSICTTRVIAGVGVPQLSAIYAAASEAKGAGVPVIADGGLRYSGDIVKALAAGGDCVMIGSMFAGTEEAPGETIIYNGRKFKSYRGMGSIDAMKA
ncbi:MAG: IMP dehydrogenase, partial [Alistipes sp.]|nr:IMP dehydrogenase [Alistipes sp.]